MAALSHTAVRVFMHFPITWTIAATAKENVAAKTGMSRRSVGQGMRLLKQTNALESRKITSLDGTVLYLEYRRPAQAEAIVDGESQVVVQVDPQRADDRSGRLALNSIVDSCERTIEQLDPNCDTIFELNETTLVDDDHRQCFRIAQELRRFVAKGKLLLEPIA